MDFSYQYLDLRMFRIGDCVCEGVFRVWNSDVEQREKVGLECIKYYFIGQYEMKVEGGILRVLESFG